MGESDYLVQIMEGLLISGTVSIVFYKTSAENSRVGLSKS